MAIIGAGYAGLAAAVRLADAGVPLTLFEATRAAGGRARRVHIAGTHLDNGQHLLLGAYRQTLALMERVAPGSSTRLLRRLPLHLERSGAFRLRAPHLPAPAHLVAALLFARGLNWSERLGAIGFALRQRLGRFRAPPDQTVAALLAGQAARARRELWEPLCLAALNTPPESASAQVFLNVIEASFAHHRADSDLLLPAADLGQLLPEPALRHIEAQGAEIRMGTPVRGLAAGPGGWTLTTDSGQRHFAAVVLAVGPHQLKAFAASSPALGQLAELHATRGYQPIHTVYFQFQGARLSHPILALDGAPGQWLVDRGQLGGPAGLLALVISATTPELAASPLALERLARAQLQRGFPNLAEPLWARVLAEKHATYSCLPGQSAPPTEPAPQLFLAGDYCYTHFPATLEAAVRSGAAAAQALLSKR
ncbi:MAG: FAD-dependent oxidoreductase [Burkholderiales bacterium]|nr:MAG: FAD-dependent oxidoreductase [Burkholderiales bacterium]